MEEREFEENVEMNYALKMGSDNERRSITQPIVVKEEKNDNNNIIKGESTNNSQEEAMHIKKALEKDFDFVDENKYKEEVYVPCGGCLILFISFLVLGTGIALIVIGAKFQISVLIIVGVIILIFSVFFIMPGLFCISPNSGAVTILCGKYFGTIKETGFLYTPICVKRIDVSFKSRNVETGVIKVNDSHGNPILISAIVITKMNESARAIFDIENLDYYIRSQSVTAVRKLASRYPYDDHEEGGLNLKDGGEEINQELVKEIQERLHPAGMLVEEARIIKISYAEEIAPQMLKRQQADAIIAARQKIVNGGVGIVHMAINSMTENEICELTREDRVKLASNLLIVLCSDNQVNPMVNTGI